MGEQISNPIKEHLQIHKKNKDKEKKMKLFFKTLDQKKFSMEVDKEETVEDLICKLEDEKGRENLYRLIYAGKILKEEDIINDCNITGKIPIILMVTRAPDTINSFSDSVEKFEHENNTVDKFDSVIDVIQSCEYLKNGSDHKIISNSS